jgi:hypothetical protein
MGETLQYPRRHLKTEVVAASLEMLSGGGKRSTPRKPRPPPMSPLLRLTVRPTSRWSRRRDVTISATGARWPWRPGPYSK